MKHCLGISTLSVICALCAAAATDAYGAASVRTLGGAGTYSSASAATSAATSGTPSAAINAVRGGSMRVTPTTNKTATATSTTKTTGTTATSQRLSIGKYLGGSTSVSGGSSTRPGNSSGGTTDPDIAAGLEKRVEYLEDTVSNVYDKDSVDAMLDKKQGVLTTGDNIVIVEGDEVYIDTDELKNALDIAAGTDGREVVIGSNATDLLWKYDGDTDWTVLISKSELVGPQGPQGEKGEPGTAADMDLYSTTAEMNAAIADAISLAAANYATQAQLADYLKTADAQVSFNNVAQDIDTINTSLAGKADTSALANYATTEALTTGLAGKADTDSVYTKTEVDEKVANVVAGDMSEALKGYATTEALTTGLAGKADASALANYATTEALTTGLAGKAAADDLTVLQNTVTSVSSVADAAKTAADTAQTTADGAAALATSVNTALSGKADKSDLDNYATKAEIPTVPTLVSAFENDAGYLTAHQSLDGYATKVDVAAKQDALTEAQMAAVNSGITSADVLQITTNTTEIAKKANAADVYTAEQVNATFATKEELDNIQAGGDVDLTAYAKTADVDAKLQDYAKKGEITNADIAENAAIAKSKLDIEVQTSLTKADNAITTEGVPSQTGSYVVAIIDGEKQFLDIVE